MKRRTRIVIIILAVLAVISLLIGYLHGHNIAVLEPAGLIADKERNLIIIGVVLSAIVVIPVYIMTASIAWKYRESNPKATYQPDWDHSRLYETIWWGIPMIIITILSVVAWQSAHDLDPFKPINSKVPPLNVQVLSLDWKWLFIYPQQNIASVNLLGIPENTPINFNLSSDTVMNSFWIPNLGGQIYTMPGMSTQLHLIANKIGSYYGSSANISGTGFAGMAFRAKAMSSTDFASWVHFVQSSPNTLSMTAYHKLAKPSVDNPVSYYSSVANDLYNTTVVKYMVAPNQSMSGMMAQGSM